MSNKEKVKVSIILPVYNVSRYLDECVCSILKQTYQNIEIIFVDDGSTDDSGRILDEYQKKDKRIQVIHKANGGVSSAKNAGLKIATGDYITFIDPDDYVMEDYVAYLLDLAICNNADISLSKMMFDNYNMKQSTRNETYIFSSDQALIDILSYNINVAVWNKMYKSSLINDYNIQFYEDIFMGEGFNFNVCAFQNASKIAVGFRKVYFYRRDNNESATTKFRIEKWENAIYAIDMIQKNVVSTNKKVQRALKFAFWRTHVDGFTLLCLAGLKKEYQDFYKKTLKVGRKYFYIPFLLKTSGKDKIRGIVILFCPSLLSQLLLLRRKAYKVDIKN